MLHIITGRSGTGKTTYVNKILGELAQDGNDRLLLIVPEQFSFASERSILTELGTRNAQNTEVLSFTRLADYVGRSIGGIAHDVADEGTKVIVMIRALEGIKDKLSIYASHTESIALAHKLTDLVSEFKRERITPQMLNEASNKTEIQTLSVKLRELALIYATYSSMFENRYDDVSTVTDKLCSTLSSTDFFSGYTIVIDSFKGFTAQEYEIIKHLIKQSENTYITLCTDDIYGNDPSMIWSAVNETGKRLSRIAKECGVKTAVLNVSEKSNCTRFNSDTLKYIERNLFNPISVPYDKQTGDIILFNSPTLQEECAFIAATARKHMRTDGTRLKDMAVIVRDEDDYNKELISAFSRFEIPVFEDKRQPILNQPLISLCKSVLEICTGGFTTENILHYLKTGLSPLNEFEISELENYALMWQFTSKSWRNDFTLNPSGLNSGTDEKSIEALRRLNDMRKRIMLPLTDLKSSLTQSDDTKITALHISKSIYGFLLKTEVNIKLRDMARTFYDDGYTALADEQNRVWEILMETLNKLGTVYGDYQTSAETYYKLFCAVISFTDLGNIPHALDEITIGSADRIRLSSPKIVFVAGCAEGVFPKSADSHGILTDSDRRNLSLIGIELSASNELASCEERFIAYSAITAPTDKLYLSYHRTEGANESLLPSVIYENILSLFNGKDGVGSVIDTDNLPIDYFAETEESLFISYASAFSKRHIKKTDSDFKTELASLRTAVENRENYKDKLTSLDSLITEKSFEIKSKEIATELFGKHMGISASRVETYHQCAFKYFCKYGLRAMPREKAELNPAVSGTVIHFVLEKIIAENGKDGLLAMDTDSKKAAVDRWLLTYLNDTIGGFDDKTLRFKYLYNRLAFTLYDILNRLCDEFSVSDFSPCDFELAIGNEETGIPAYKLELDDGGYIELHGSIDRVDKYEHDGKTYIRIVDYKSGGKEFVLSDILAGLNMQMLIYLFAIWANGEKRYGDIIPAGILYYPAKRKPVRMSDKRMSPEKVTDIKNKQDRCNGLFLSDENVIEAMEHGTQNRFYSLTDKKGNLKDELITLENMGLLKKRADRILKDMAVNLQNGKIAAHPINCDYCDYASVCRFEDGEFKEVNKMKPSEVYKFLAESESEGGNENE